MRTVNKRNGERKNSIVFLSSLGRHKSDHLISPHLSWNCIAQWVGFLLCRDKAKRPRLMELGHLRPLLTAAQPFEKRIRQAKMSPRELKQSRRKNRMVVKNWKGNCALATHQGQSQLDWSAVSLLSLVHLPSNQANGSEFPKHNSLTCNKSEFSFQAFNQPGAVSRKVLVVRGGKRWRFCYGETAVGIGDVQGRCCGILQKWEILERCGLLKSYKFLRCPSIWSTNVYRKRSK